MFRKKPLIVLIAGLFLLSLACSSLTGTDKDSGGKDTGGPSSAPTEQSDDKEPSSEPGKESTEKPRDDSGPSTPDKVKAGESFKNGWFQLVVLGWTDVEPTEMTKPDSGNKLIAIDITAVNLGKDLHQLYEYGFSIKDSESREYDDYVYLDMTSSGYETRNIFPGDRWTGSFGFQVPEDSSGYTLVMNEDSYNKFDRVLIELNSGPGVIEPPASIEGEKAAEVYPAGEAAPCGDLTLQADTTKRTAFNDFYLSLVPSGFELLLTELVIKNTSSSGMTLNEMGMFWLQAPSGRRYGQSFLAEAVGSDEVQGSFFGYDDEIAGGETLRGWMGFGVPEDLADPRLVFWCGRLESDESLVKVDIALP
jgi:hypothetical protein